MLGADQLRSLLGGRRRGQLGVEQTPVARHPAACRADRLVHPLGHRRRDLAELALQTEMPGRTGRVYGDGAELAQDLEVREQALRPGDRVKDLELLVSLAILVGEPVGGLARESK